MTEAKWKNCSKCGGEIRACVCLGVELESCQNCGGFFLDSKLIQKIPVLAQSDAIDLGKRSDQAVFDKAVMVCPKCQRHMAKKAYRRGKAIVLDVCPSCQGVWFDAGEYARFFGLALRKAAKKDVYKVHLFCDACNSVIRKPKKEQNACEQCGNRLGLSLHLGSLPPFWRNNHLCAAVLFVAGIGIIYFAALRSFENIFQAFALTFLGIIPLIYAIRAFIYSKVFMRGRTAVGQDYDI